MSVPPLTYAVEDYEHDKEIEHSRGRELLSSLYDEDEVDPPSVSTIPNTFSVDAVPQEASSGRSAHHLKNPAERRRKDRSQFKTSRGHRKPQQAATETVKPETFGGAVVENFYRNLQPNSFSCSGHTEIKLDFSDNVIFLLLHKTTEEFTESFNGKNQVKGKYLSLIKDDHIEFNPNISSEGTVEVSNTYGLNIMIITCGVFYRNHQQVGNFEQMLGLMQDSFDRNAFKIQVINLKMKQCSIQMQPALRNISQNQLTNLCSIWQKCDSCHKVKEPDIVPFVICSAQHYICSECLNEQAIQFLEYADTLLFCPNGQCIAHIPEDIAAKVLQEDLFSYVQRKLHTQSLEIVTYTKNIQRCPFCKKADYTEIIEQKRNLYKCYSCKQISCINCGKDWFTSNHELCVERTPSQQELYAEAMSLTAMPVLWIPMTSYTNEPFIVVTLDTGSNECSHIRSLFGKTLEKDRIHNVYRIQNKKLQEMYNLKKKHMMDTVGPEQLNERSLFHGTHWESVEYICREGFDIRICGKNATKFGRGSYFAKCAEYSDKYSSLCTQSMRSKTELSFERSLQNSVQTYSASEFNTILQIGFKYMFVARVLVGKYTTGKEEYKKPPYIAGDPQKRLYDSCVNNEQKPLIYVIFETAQSYPEYIIQYK